MSTENFAEPASAISPQLPRHSAGTRLLRPVLALGLVAVGVVLVLEERTARGVEAILSSWAMPLIFADEAIASASAANPTVSFSVDDRWFALRVTPECSIAFYLSAIFILSAVLCLFRRFAIGRVLLAASISVLALFLLNLTRSIALGYILITVGRDEFDWAHTIGGSFVMMAGLSGSLALFFFVAIRHRRGRPD